MTLFFWTKCYEILHLIFKGLGFHFHQFGLLCKILVISQHKNFIGAWQLTWQPELKSDVIEFGPSFQHSQFSCMWAEHCSNTSVEGKRGLHFLATQEAESKIGSCQEQQALQACSLADCGKFRLYLARGRSLSQNSSSTGRPREQGTCPTQSMTGTYLLLGF